MLRTFWGHFKNNFEWYSKCLRSKHWEKPSKLFEKWPQNVRNKFSILDDKKSSWYQLAGVISAAMQQLSLLNFWASASSTAADWGSSSSQLLSAENQRALWKFLFKTLSKSACRCIKLRNWENQSKKKLKLKLSTAETSFSCEPVFYERA